MSIEQVLNGLIDEWLDENKLNQDWRYYFIKYKEILSSISNMFTWKTESDYFEICCITKFKVSSWHINPYVHAVIKLINDESIATLNGSYCKGMEPMSPLCLTGKEELWCEQDGWRVKCSAKMLSKLTKTSLSPHPTAKGQYLLVDTVKRDRI